MEEQQQNDKCSRFHDGLKESECYLCWIFNTWITAGSSLHTAYCRYLIMDFSDGKQLLNQERCQNYQFPIFITLMLLVSSSSYKGNATSRCANPDSFSYYIWHQEVEELWISPLLDHNWQVLLQKSITTHNFLECNCQKDC